MHLNIAPIHFDQLTMTMRLPKRLQCSGARNARCKAQSMAGNSAIDAMQIFQKLVRNEQHMALNVFLCANNEYFYHVM